MIWRLFFLSFALLLSSCTMQEKQVKKADLHFDLARSLIKKCKYPSALAEVKKALKIKKEPEYYHIMALLYFQFKKYDKSIENFKTALKKNPKLTSVRIDLARSLVETNKVDQALKELEKAKEDLTYRYRENIHAQTGLAHFKKKNYKLAEKHFQTARVAKKTDCFLALYHAQSLYFSEQWDLALKILEPSKKWCKKPISSCDKSSFDSYFFAGLIYDKKGRRDKAFGNLKIFLKNAKESEHIPLAEEKIKLWRNLN